MTRMRSWLILAVALLLAAPLSGTGTTGTIVGTVTDPSGAVVVGARVLVRNQGTNMVRDAATDDTGDFSVTLLPPGLYQVSFEKSGFRRGIYNNVKLDIDQTVRLDCALQLGELSQEFVIKEAVPLIQTDTSTMGQVMDQPKVNRLPLNERNFLNFAVLVPGAQLPAEGSQSSAQGGAVSVNGAREQSNNFLLDGVENNDLYINQFAVLPSVDAIQEFKVQSSNYSAEFGRGGGAQINVVLKGGTNEFHGGAFEFVRNRHLDAKNFFDAPDCSPSSVPGTCAAIPRFDRNQFGGTFGGPLHRDKIFFFTSYEGLRMRQATTRQAVVPSQLQRLGILSSLPPSFQNPAGVAILGLYPAANVGPDLLTSNTFVSAPVIRNTGDLFSLRIDVQPGKKDTFSGHYSLFREHRFSPFDPVNNFTNLPGYGSFALTLGQNVALNWNHTFDSRWLSEFRFGFSRLRAQVLQEHSGVNKSQALGFPTVLTNPVDLGFPNITLLGFDGVGEPINYPQDRANNNFEFVENVAWNAGGRHQIRFGADLRHTRLSSYLDFLARGEWFFLGGLSGDPMVALGQLVTGMPDFAVAVRGDTFNDLRANAVNFYFQDDIVVRPRFVMNLGLRYEFVSPPVEVRDRFSVPDLSSNSLLCAPQPDCQFIQAGTHGIPRGIYEKDLNNFAPRIGLAWRPLASERFVVRSAYGIFYDSGILNQNIFPRFNPPFYEVVFFPNSGTNVIQNILNQPGFVLTQASIVAPSFRSGYMQHWNLDAQYELRPNWVLDLAYVGSKGTHLPAGRDLNQPPPATGIPPFPQFSSILAIESRASSTYHSLQLRSEKRLTAGSAFLAAYTWSKSIDDVSEVFGSGVTSGLPQDSQNTRAERALSDFHAKHRLAFSYVYEVPFGNGRRWLNRPGVLNGIVGGWQFSGIVSLQTGHPFTVNRSTTQSMASLAAFGVPDRPNVLVDPFQVGPVMSNPDPACHLTRSHGGRAADETHVADSWFNPCAFALPAPGTFGNAGRNIVLAPGLKNLDVSFLKEVTMRERHRLQFRADIFNLFNHPNFDAPSRIFESPNFGALQSANIMGTKPPRQIQLGVKYAF